MSNDEKQALSEAQNMLAGELVKAAGRWALATSAQWRGAQPGNYATFKNLFDTGKAGVRISITLGVDLAHQVDIVGVVDGKEYPIAWQNVSPSDGVAATH